MNKVLYQWQTNPGGTLRLWVNVAEVADASIGFDKQRYLLDMLSCWGASDTMAIQCVDGSTTYSWEFPQAQNELLSQIIRRFEVGTFNNHHSPKWKAEEFFKLESKNAKARS